MLPAGDVDIDTGTLVEIQSWIVSSAVKGILPIGRFQPYVALGVGFMEVDVDVQDKTVLMGGGNRSSGGIGRVGGGFDVYLSNHVVANVAIDYVIPSSSIGDFDYISFGAGIQYRF